MLETIFTSFENATEKANDKPREKGNPKETMIPTTHTNSRINRINNRVTKLRSDKEIERETMNLISLQREKRIEEIEMNLLEHEDDRQELKMHLQLLHRHHHPQEDSRDAYTIMFVICSYNLSPNSLALKAFNSIIECKRYIFVYCYNDQNKKSGIRT